MKFWKTLRRIATAFVLALAVACLIAALLHRAQEAPASRTKQPNATSGL